LSRCSAGGRPVDSGVGGMTTIGGKLYMTSNGSLYETTTAGKYVSLGGSWEQVPAATALDGKLYLVSSGTLYVVDVK
jgi:hypothetical protein